ncbi:MAG TPA: hypothetical protein VGN16_06695 [Acidobacteriaceae bacterium]|jgi:ligand-binding SRPBCC domain-containing protein
MRDFECDPVVESITVNAPIERCWALSTRVELVQKTLGMRLAGGVTRGHITADSRVQWRGWKFGLPTTHHSLITAFEPPHAERSPEPHLAAFFQDTQESGRFARFRHDHVFTQATHENVRSETVMLDRISFALPWGMLGRVIAQNIMAPHIRKLARERFVMIKELAEGEGWRAWVDGDTSPPDLP